MDTPKLITTVLSMTTPQGHIIAQALHKSGPGYPASSGAWPCTDDGKPCTWALQLGYDLWRTDQHLLLPEPVRGLLLALEAQTVEEASEAVERAAYALEAFLQDFALLQRGLEHRIAKAQEYGRTPELPLDEAAASEDHDHGSTLSCRVCGPLS